MGARSPPFFDRIPPVPEKRKSPVALRLAAVLTTAALAALALTAPASTTAAAADPAPAAQPDPANPWQYDHWPMQQPWQESSPDAKRVAQPGFGAAIDPQDWENPDHMTWSDYKKPPGTNWADPSKKGSVRTFKGALVLVDYPNQPFVITQPKGSTVFGNPSAAANGIPRAEVRGLLPRLPQQAQRAQPRPHPARVLDGGLRRPVRRGTDLLRCLPTARQVARVRDGVPGRYRLSRRRHVQQEHPHRRPGGLGRRCGRGGTGRVRLHLLPQRRPGRIVHLAGVRADEVPDQGRRQRRLRPAGPAAAELEQHPVRRVDVVGSRLDPLAQRGRRLDHPGRELRHVRLRARAESRPRHRRQLQQPVRRTASPCVQRDLGDAQPRHVQRPGWSPQPLDDPGDRWRVDGRATHAPQQDQARDGRRAERPAPEPRGPRPVRRRGSRRHGTGRTAGREGVVGYQHHARHRRPLARVLRRRPTRCATAAVTTTTRSRSSTGSAPTPSPPTPGSCWPRPRTRTRRRSSGSSTRTRRTST